MRLYGVVTMDIVGSKKIMDRGLIQDELINCINIVNEKYAHILPTPITITLGDEWQLITDHPWRCYDLIHEFQQLLWPAAVDLYAGIGIGTIDTSLDADIRKVDGPCFHMAREAINMVREFYRLKDDVIHSSRNKVYFKPSPKAFSILDTHFSKDEAFNYNMDMDQEAALDIDEIEGKERDVKFSKSVENIINTIIENNEILKKKMTQKQKKIYIDYMKVRSYRKIAEMHVSERETISSISQKLNSAEFFTIQHNHKTVSTLIYNLYKNALQADRINKLQDNNRKLL